MDTRTRSVAKAFAWRLAGLVITTAVAWIVTRRIDVAASIGAADSLVKLAAYYAHERVWLRVKFGGPRPPEYQI